MHALDLIDPQTLTAVTGGADTFGPGAGPNRFRAEGQVEGSGYGFSVKGQGNVETAKTNYAVCMDAARTPEERKSCLPLATSSP